MSIFSQMHFEILLLISSFAVPSIDSIEQESARCRDQIVSGEIEYEVSCAIATRHSDAVEWKPPYVRDRLVFDRKAGFHAMLNHWIQEEMLFLQKDGEPVVRRNEDRGTCRRILLRPDRIYEFYPDAAPGGMHSGILEYRTSDSPLLLQQVLRPWNFGLIPDIVESNDLDSFPSVIQSVGAVHPLISEEIINGSKCWRVEYRPEHERVLTIWYDAEKRMSVCRIVLEGSNENGAWRNTLTSNLKSYGDGVVWFPSEFHLRSETLERENSPIEIGGTNDFDKLVLQRVRVSKARFNIDISPAEFTIAGLKPVGRTQILRQFPSDDQPDEEWDGELASVERRMNENLSSKSNPKRTRAMTLIVCGNLLLIVSAAVWWMFRWKQRTSASKD